MRPLPALLVLAALLAAGCATPFGPASGDGAPTGDAAPRVAYLHSEMRLAAAPEPHASAVRTGGFFAAWAGGADYPTWTSPAYAEDVLVENLTLDLVLRVTGPVARTFRFPDVMAYGGAHDAWMGYGNVTTPPVLLPGGVYRYEIPIGVPEGGLWVPRGHHLGVKVVPVMHQNDAADVEVLVGGDSPSALSWRERPATFPWRVADQGRDSGEVTGSAYAGAAAPPTTRHRTVLEPAEPPTMLLAWMNTTDHAGIPDLDLSVEGPGGGTLAFSGTPTPREAIRLGAPNLRGAGEYALVVANYGSARATFTVEWVLG